MIEIRTLVAEARSAGLNLRIDGNLLRITGRRGAGEIAKELLNRKAEVVEYLGDREKIALLTAQAEPEGGDAENTEMHDSALFAEPAESCPVCGGPVQVERGKYFVHIWCPAGGFDSWRAVGKARLSETDAKLFNGGRE